jgi:hypothetical protein
VASGGGGGGGGGRVQFDALSLVYSRPLSLSRLSFSSNQWAARGCGGVGDVNYIRNYYQSEATVSLEIQFIGYFSNDWCNFAPSGKNVTFISFFSEADS